MKEATTHKTTPHSWLIGFIFGCLLCFCLPWTALGPIDGPQSLVQFSFTCAMCLCCVRFEKQMSICVSNRFIYCGRAGRIRNKSIVLTYTSIHIAPWST